MIVHTSHANTFNKCLEKVLLAMKVPFICVKKNPSHCGLLLHCLYFKNIFSSIEKDLLKVILLRRNMHSFFCKEIP